MKVLFLDDDPKRLFKFKSYISSAILAATAEEMIQLLSELKETAKCVFLDHDLGGRVYVDSSDKETGMEVVRWIVKNNPDVQKFVVHSLNLEASESMIEKLKIAGYEAEYIPFTEFNYNNLYDEFKDCLEDEEDIECE